MKPELIAVEGQYLSQMTSEEIRALADFLVKHYPEVADKFETALGNSFFDNNAVV
jgi:hypothetical protein